MRVPLPDKPRDSPYKQIRNFSSEVSAGRAASADYQRMASPRFERERGQEGIGRPSHGMDYQHGLRG